MKTLDGLVTDVRSRLGDLSGDVWPDEDIVLHLVNGYQQIASSQDVFFDQVYLENLPRVMTLTQAWERKYLPRIVLSVAHVSDAVCSYTQPWEQVFVTRNAWTDNGWSDFTARWEPDELPDEFRLAGGMGKRGPATHTNAFEATDGDLLTLGLLATRVTMETRYGGLYAGQGNVTATFELALATDMGDSRQWVGPAVCTALWEATDGFLVRAGCDGSIPATADVPDRLTSLTRAVWDRRGLDVLSPRQMQTVDARYELTTGEVYGIMWEKDGFRTVRKVRVPAASADVVTVTEDVVGVCRNWSAVTADAVTGTYGTARRVPGHHPIGDSYYGSGRRPYLDGKNVRLEMFRQGRALAQGSDVCELPDRYAVYLRDFALSQLLAHAGPGQDLALAAHFGQRWARGLARIARRLDVMNREKTIVLGGQYRGLARRPPRPRLPWNYGREVR